MIKARERGWRRGAGGWPVACRSEDCLGAMRQRLMVRAATPRPPPGERMNPAAMTAAHRTLPFGTKLKVTNQRNGKTVVVRINDRGPFIRGRVIDLSKAAAVQLGFIRSGHTKICMIKT